MKQQPHKALKDTQALLATITADEQKREAALALQDKKIADAAMRNSARQSELDHDIALLADKLDSAGIEMLKGLGEA